MREMKESGVYYLGKIPKDWNVRKYKNFSKNRMGETILAEDTYEEGIPIYSATQEDKIFGYTHNAKFILKQGDIVIPARGNSIGCATLIKDDEATCTQTTIGSYEIQNINNVFLYYSILGLKDEWFRFDGSAIPQITVDQVKNNKLAVPDKSIQEKIVNILSKKINEIDNVIEKTKETIEDYKKYKQSYISKVITKGLEQTKEIKDSNVEYIGKCPKDWEIMKLKFAAKIRNEKYEEQYGDIEYFALENIESESGKFINTDNIYDREGSIICNKDDVVFGKLRPYLAKVYKVKNLSCCSSEFAVFYDFKGKVDYLKYLLLSYGFIKIVDASTYGTKMPRANIDFIKNMLIPLPNTETQERIASHLNNKCEEIDILIENKQRIIEELEQYKKSLIYEYVTGKKEVV